MFTESRRILRLVYVSFYNICYQKFLFFLIFHSIFTFSFIVTLSSPKLINSQSWRWGTRRIQRWELCICGARKRASVHKRKGIREWGERSVALTRSYIVFTWERSCTVPLLPCLSWTPRVVSRHPRRLVRENRHVTQLSRKTDERFDPPSVEDSSQCKHASSLPPGEPIFHTSKSLLTRTLSARFNLGTKWCPDYW